METALANEERDQMRKLAVEARMDLGRFCELLIGLGVDPETLATARQKLLEEKEARSR